MANRGGRPPAKDDDDTAFSVAEEEDEVQVLEEKAITWPSNLSMPTAAEERRDGPFLVPSLPSRRLQRVSFQEGAGAFVSKTGGRCDHLVLLRILSGRKVSCIPRPKN